MWKRFIGELNKRFRDVGSILIAVALVATIIEEVKLLLSIKLLVIGIMVIIITSWYLSKEENND
jgi:type III secretory pathway component EscS